MSAGELFSGPPANKATGATLAAAVVTLFWTIAAHTFWKNMNGADMALYISTSTILFTAIVGFAIPESAAYTEYNRQRLATQSSAQGGGMALTKDSAKGALEDQLQKMQEQQNAIASRLGVTPAAPGTRPAKVISRRADSH
jgi:hypothetical protein